MVTGHHLEEVVTGSMQPTIPIGSLVVTEQLPAGQLQVGDVLVFPDPNDTKLTIVHRIVWLSHDQSGDVLVRTKGDYNAEPDLDDQAAGDRHRRPGHLHRPRARERSPGISRPSVSGV